MNNVGDTVIKFLSSKKKQRWIVESTDLFDLLNSMGILNDPESLNVVMEHLEDSGIDVNFRDTDSEYYKIYKDIERRYKFLKQMKFKREDVTKMIKKVEEIKTHPDDSFLNYYMEDTDEESPELAIAHTIQANPDILALNERIMSEVTDRIIQNLNQLSDQERLENAMNQLENLNNILNNNQNGNI